VVKRLLAAGAAVEAASNTGRGLGKGILKGGANNVNRGCLLKVGVRLNEFLFLEKTERNMKKPQSFKDIWKKTHFDGRGVEL